ncbi:MAG: DUF5320 domain-containing protein [Methanophagales archaeon]|nr:DUF5320 domain-containing protein [Methanophagales archaeon]
MRGNRHRNMYNLTGLPGWMRFGYSPGWVGRSPTGLPPAAQYLAQTGQMPQFSSWQEQQGAPVAPMDMSAMPKDQEVSMLESQADMLGKQLEQIKKKLEDLRQ